MRRQKVPCRILDLSTGRIGVAPAKEIEKVLTAYKELVLHKSRIANFVEIEVIYKDVDLAEKMTGRKLMSEK